MWDKNRARLKEGRLRASSGFSREYPLEPGTPQGRAPKTERSAPGFDKRPESETNAVAWGQFRTEMQFRRKASDEKAYRWDG